MQSSFATPHPFLLHFGGSFGFSTTQPAEWLIVAGAIGLLVGLAIVFARAGRPAGGRGLSAILLRIGDGLERVTGFPAWCAAGRIAGAWALGVGLLGFVWDVAWHTDLGRDRVLFTVPHTLIIFGLVGIAAAGAASVFYATMARANVGWRVGRLVVPAGAAVMLALGAAAALAFPLDDLWHSVYGIDVTMWSPTHLMMIGGASLAPLALALLLWEAPPGRRKLGRQLEIVTFGAILVGLSTFQLEFDMGVPQWQALFQPVLIALAAGFALTAARVLLGRGAALRTVFVFLVLRGVIAVVVGPVLAHTTPHFPPYIVEAACVELAFLVPTTPVLRAVIAGGLIGTAGMAAEWGWMQVWGLQPWQDSMIPQMWVPLLAAVGASLVGLAFGAGLARAGGVAIRVPRYVAAAGLAVMLLTLAIPLPRSGSATSVAITTWQVGAVKTGVDRNGQTVTTRDVAVNVRLTPPDAAAGADWFRVAAWQGGGVVNTPLVEASPGDYVATGTVPVGGDWKAMVFLARGSELAAAPVAMPAEPDQGLGAIPLLATRTAPLAPADLLLLRENAGGSPLVAIIAYALFGTTLFIWVGILALGLHRAGSQPTLRVKHAREAAGGAHSRRVPQPADTPARTV